MEEESIDIEKMNGRSALCNEELTTDSHLGSGNVSAIENKDARSGP